MTIMNILENILKNVRYVSVGDSSYTHKSVHLAWNLNNNGGVQPK